MLLLINYTNLQGRLNVTGWRDFDVTDLQTYIGLMLLAGVYWYRNESTRSLWDHNAWAIFWAMMSHATFRLINTWRRLVISELWEMWTAWLTLIQPGS